MFSRGIRSTMVMTALCASVVLAPSAAQADGTQNVDKMVESFSKCASREGAADVLVLLDQSASLSGPYTDSNGQTHEATDPDDLRVSAALDLVGQFKAFSDDTGVKVNLAVAGFDGNFHKGDWTVISDDSISAIREELRTVGEQDDGRETDYFNALQGASEEVGKSGGQCRLLVFFTDGEYDVDGSYGSKDYSEAKDWTQVEKDGQAQLCNPKGGPLNVMRT